jgi:hypothetical protein
MQIVKMLKDVSDLGTVRRAVAASLSECTARLFSASMLYVGM